MSLHRELDGIRDRVRKESRRLSRFKPEDLDTSSSHCKSVKRQRGDIELKVRRLVEELEQIGCYLEDGVAGIVAFPSFVGDELVFLSWRYGEPDIAFFHGPRESFSKRKPFVV